MTHTFQYILYYWVNFMWVSLYITIWRVSPGYLVGHAWNSPNNRKYVGNIVLPAFHFSSEILVSMNLSLWQSISIKLHSSLLKCQAVSVSCTQSCVKSANNHVSCSAPNLTFFQISMGLQLKQRRDKIHPQQIWHYKISWNCPNSHLKLKIIIVCQLI